MVITMSKMIDIASKLVDEEKFLQFGPNKHYKVNDSKNAVMQVNAIVQNGTEVEAMDEAIKLILGKKAFAEIEEMDLSMSSYQAIFIGMMALISGKEFDEMEKSFRAQE